MQECYDWSLKVSNKASPALQSRCDPAPIHMVWATGIVTMAIARITGDTDGADRCLTKVQKVNSIYVRSSRQTIGMHHRLT